MKTPLTEGRSNRRRMTAAASWVGTPAIAEIAEGPHFVARPVIPVEHGGLRAGKGMGVRRPAGPPSPHCRPARLRLTGLRVEKRVKKGDRTRTAIPAVGVGSRALRPTGGRGSVQRNRLDAARVVVGRPVDVRAHRMGRHGVRRVRTERNLLAAREPGIPGVRRQNDRHAAVHRRHRLVGGGGEDRAGLDRVLRDCARRAIR